ncbi:MAG: LuxR C-terminal-related transcriptional regulator [Planctomycetota bacterium]
MEISSAAFDRLVELWDRLEAHPVHAETEANLYLMKTLAEWLSADYAYWCGLVRVADGDTAAGDPLGGWRMRVTEQHKMPEVYGQNSGELLENQHLAETVGAASIAIMAEAGEFRVRLLRDLVDLSEYEQSEHFERFQMPYGLTDRVYLVTPVNEDTESCYVFELAGGERRFTAEEVWLIGAALRGVRWFQRRLILSHGLTAGDQPLTPMERQIVQLLLTDKSEKDIAEAIERAPSTTHNYVTGIYRKFGVNNRAGLMSLWVELSG